MKKGRTATKITGGHGDVQAATPLSALLRETLDTATDYTRRLRNGLRGIAEQFEAGESDAALSNLSAGLDGLNWLIGVYDRCRFFMASPVRPGEEAVMGVELLASLRHLVDLVDQRDFGAAALDIRQRLMPRVETLCLRVEELARLRTDPN